MKKGQSLAILCPPLCIAILRCVYLTTLSAILKIRALFHSSPPGVKNNALSRKACSGKVGGFTRFHFVCIPRHDIGDASTRDLGFFSEIGFWERKPALLPDDTKTFVMPRWRIFSIWISNRSRRFLLGSRTPLHTVEDIIYTDDSMALPSMKNQMNLSSSIFITQSTFKSISPSISVEILKMSKIHACDQ